ncbi:uncharacterized protein K460DRAFT_392946 [Cucurbitaria berberidis CBS 394.84]|uniref:Uncharacterized protein n=1 Tax=Cucurbitaria berberidis CBS 394.84 TaxID=1168544 RepID=A0A9P4GJX1_9PLEO|nr:uncharacterized protein K460DRAFT_392946 [Cucurbitaria berberidis CBS 394.84]KAF1847648.1 hypothetical protein K460DRAFT_392946 [Cucurbitaria berberidis CBS 394.84]
MHANFFLALLVPVSGALAQATCAEAPSPAGQAALQGACNAFGSTRTDCATGVSLTQIWYAPPGCNAAGVLRLRNTSPNNRKIVQVRSGPLVANFWVNGGGECVTNLPLTVVRGFGVWENQCKGYDRIF